MDPTQVASFEHQKLIDKKILTFLHSKFTLVMHILYKGLSMKILYHIKKTVDCLWPLT